MTQPQLNKLAVVALGSLMIIAGLTTPTFFWTQPHLRRLRAGIGDRGTQVLHVLLGIGVILLGLYAKG